MGIVVVYKKEDGSYISFIWGGYKQQIPVLFDVNGNLWVYNSEDVYDWIDNWYCTIKEILLVKYLNGEDGKLIVRYWSDDVNRYDNDEAKEIFNTYEKMEVCY